MTLREAARRTARSVTTLRRSIRAGRLHATKRHGRFGPEYFVTPEQLRTAGFHLPFPDDGDGRPVLPAPATGARIAASDPARAELVPVSLYRELQMKHEQLLVQYGMIRAAGLRQMEQRDDVVVPPRALDGTERRAVEEIARLRHELRASKRAREGQEVEIAALREKLRALEMLTRNAATSEDIDRQFRQIVDQSRRVERLASGLAAERPAEAGRFEPDH
jgi:hypothetical protein